MIAIVLLTYNRPEYAERTLRSTLDNIHTLHDLHVHIADDGTSEEYRDNLLRLAGGYSKVKSVSVSNSNHKGYGCNYNLATQQVHQFADCILPLEDDWELTRSLDLDVLVQAVNHTGIGCIRLGYMGYTQLLKCEFFSCAGYHWLLLDHNSPEPHVFSGHPRFETRDWERSVGPWPEGLEPGRTEFVVAHNKAARRGVVWPVDLVKPSGDLFVHIGTVRSY